MLSGLRELFPAEREIVDALLGVDFPGRDQLRLQIAHAPVWAIDENGSLAFGESGQAKATVVRRIPVEAEAKDADGIALHVLLHVVDGHARELEVYKEDSSRLVRFPRANELAILVL
jgi:hypothetical protein